MPPPLVLPEIKRIIFQAQKAKPDAEAVLKQTLSEFETNTEQSQAFRTGKDAFTFADGLPKETLYSQSQTSEL